MMQVYSFIRPSMVYGAEHSKSVYGTKSDAVFTCVGHNLNGGDDILAAIEKRGNRSLRFEKHPSKSSGADYWLKFFGRWNFSAVFNVLGANSVYFCGQPNERQLLGQERTEINPLYPFANWGFVFHFSDHPERAKGLEIIAFEHGRQAVRGIEIQSVQKGVYDQLLCGLRCELVPCAYYGEDLSSILKNVWPEGFCFPDASEMLAIAA
jgi:hypothetical protein